METRSKRNPLSVQLKAIALSGLRASLEVGPEEAKALGDLYEDMEYLSKLKLAYEAMVEHEKLRHISAKKTSDVQEKFKDVLILWWLLMVAVEATHNLTVFVVGLLF